MINDDIIYARISRNSNFRSAGDFFKIPPNIPDIDELAHDQIIFILYRDNSCWTAISRKSLYYKNDNEFGSIPIEIVGLQIHDYLFSLNDKISPREYVILEGEKKIWVVNAQACCGIENMILLLERHV